MPSIFVKIRCENGVYRRFQLDDNKYSYENLKAAVQASMPDFEGRLVWIDSDGDKVLIINELEWQEALRHAIDAKDGGAKMVRLETVSAQEKEQQKEAPKQQHQARGECSGFVPPEHFAVFMGPILNGLLNSAQEQQENVAAEGKSPEQQALEHVQMTANNIAEMLRSFAGVDVDIKVQPKEKTETKMEQDNQQSGEKAEEKAKAAEPQPGSSKQQQPGQAFMQNILGVLTQHQQVEKQRQIDETMKKMLTMGFTDEGGWLKTLVEAKQGNINDVLNAISAKH